MVENAANASPSPVPRACPGCGKSLWGAVKYCPFCGVAQPAQVPVAESPIAPATPEPPNSEPPKPEPPKPEPSKPELPKSEPVKPTSGARGCMNAAAILAVGSLLLLAGAWAISSFRSASSSIAECDAALTDARSELAAGRVESARLALSGSAACPQDRQGEVKALADSMQQMEQQLACTASEAEATELLSRSKPRSGRRVLNEQTAQCGSRAEFRTLLDALDREIDQAERAVADANVALARQDLDAAEAALNRARRSDLESPGLGSSEATLRQARVQPIVPLDPGTDITAVTEPNTALVDPAPPLDVKDQSIPRADNRPDVGRQVERLLLQAEEDLARRNYRGAITKAETALLLAPENRQALELKQAAESAQREALQDIVVE